MTAALRQVLICSGLDPSGGAGFIADVRVAHELGVRPVGVVTTETIQNTAGMRSAAAPDAELFGAQLSTLLSDVEVHGVKIGMIVAPETARELGAALNLTSAPVVWDPIFAPTLGDLTFERQLFVRARAELAAHLTLLTPNADELRALLGDQSIKAVDLAAAAAGLAQQWEVAVLVKGGHVSASGDVIDVLVTAGGTREEIRGERIAGGEAVHGTGCALSTAIAVHLARGAELVEACRAARTYVAGRIAAPIRPGRGAAAVV